jgi:hypothetical protein
MEWSNFEFGITELDKGVTVIPRRRQFTWVPCKLFTLVSENYFLKASNERPGAHFDQIECEMRSSVVCRKLACRRSMMIRRVSNALLNPRKLALQFHPVCFLFGHLRHE